VKERHDLVDMTADLRLLAALRKDLRETTECRSGDEALVADLVSGVMATHPAGVIRRPRPSWVSFPVAAGLVALLSAGAGAAIWSGARPWITGRGTAASSVTSPVTARDAAARRAVDRLPVAATADVTTGDVPAPLAGDVPVPLAESSSASRPLTAAPRRQGATDDSTTSASAGELFAGGNRLRRAGDYRGAATRYSRLNARHRGTPEEIACRVIFGQLLLDRLDSPRRALALFDSYLADRPDGALAEEARYGRAVALGRTGNRGAQRSAWEALLAAHPRSVYAGEARRQLTDSR
jgi:hypothetical protein